MKNRMLKMAAFMCLLPLALAACSSNEVSIQEPTNKVKTDLSSRLDTLNYDKITVQVNSVTVQEDSYLVKNVPYVSVDAFKALYNNKVEGMNNLKTKEINGEKYAKVKDIQEAIGANTYKYDKKEKVAYILHLPKGVKQITPQIPGHGAHWAKISDMMNNGGPVYGTIDGKLAFVEFEAAPEFYKNKKVETIDNTPVVNNVLPAFGDIPQPSINHVNFVYTPKGHEMMTFEHYALHAYFVTPEVVEKAGLVVMNAGNMTAPAEETPATTTDSSTEEMDMGGMKMN